jgi:hypothetical protein
MWPTDLLVGPLLPRAATNAALLSFFFSDFFYSIRSKASGAELAFISDQFIFAYSNKSIFPTVVLLNQYALEGIHDQL